MAEITTFDEKMEIKLRPIEEIQPESQTKRFDGRFLSRKSVEDDKVRGVSSLADNSVTNAMLQDNVVSQTEMQDDAIGQAELDYEQVSVTVLATATTGTATVTSGAIIVGWRATGNQDQFIDNISISGTTLTVTLAAAATADNTFQITLLKT